MNSGTSPKKARETRIKIAAKLKDQRLSMASSKPPLLLSSTSSALSKLHTVFDVLIIERESEKSDKSLYESIMKSHKDSLTLSKLAYPEYLEALISPHKSCSTCAKINNFVNTVNSKAKEETDT